jgi:hypothetical protein
MYINMPKKYRRFAVNYFRNGCNKKRTCTAARMRALRIYKCLGSRKTKTRQGRTEEETAHAVRVRFATKLVYLSAQGVCG